MSNSANWRATSYGLLAVAFFIGFFNRFAPATFSEPIASSFGLGAAELGSLASTHFWVYTLMQIPAGLIVDRYGIRTPATIGTLLTGVGAITLGVSPSYVVALAGPFLVGMGMSVVFVAMMKNNTIWFSGRRFGLITGCTLLIAALGSIASEAPAKALLALVDWRVIFIAVGCATLIVAALIGVFWRYPEISEVGSSGTANSTHLTQRSAWIDALRNGQLWLVMIAISGTNGTFYAFAGLWGTRLLGDGFGLNSDTSSIVITLALVPYGLGSLFVGHVSDYMQTRKLFIGAASLLNALAWGWLLFGSWTSVYSGLFAFLVLGLSSAQVVVSFAAVKESVPSEITGVALALVNMGVFLTTAVVQMGYGWLLSGATDAPITASDYRWALLLPAALSLLGLIAATFVRETYPSTVHPASTT